MQNVDIVSRLIAILTAYQEMLGNRRSNNWAEEMQALDRLLAAMSQTYARMEALYDDKLEPLELPLLRRAIEILDNDCYSPKDGPPAGVEAYTEEKLHEDASRLFFFCSLAQVKATILEFRIPDFDWHGVDMLLQLLEDGDRLDTAQIERVVCDCVDMLERVRDLYISTVKSRSSGAANLESSEDDWRDGFKSEWNPADDEDEPDDEPSGEIEFMLDNYRPDSMDDDEEDFEEGDEDDEEDEEDEDKDNEDDEYCASLIELADSLFEDSHVYIHEHL